MSCSQQTPAAGLRSKPSCGGRGSGRKAAAGAREHASAAGLRSTLSNGERGSGGRAAASCSRH
eukprot:629431-Alexandrium_andersonii.AAC.1